MTGRTSSDASPRPTRVLLCTPYDEGIAQGPFFGFEQYLPDLAAAGFEIERSPFVPKALSDKVRKKGHLLWKIVLFLLGYGRRVLDVVRAPFFDGIYIYNWFVPFGPAWLNELPARLYRASLLDICDRVYEPYESEAGSLVSRLRRPAHVKRLASKVDEVVVVTRFMKAELQAVGRPITVISSTLDATKYIPATAGGRRRPVVGWTGSRSTSKYLKPLESALLRARERADFDFVVVGDAEFRFNSLVVRALPWSADDEVRSLQMMDIGLYPLIDDDWVKGKAGMKALQYMAVGIPVVATPAGVTPDIVIDGVTGYLARSDEEWTEAIVRLVREPALRQKLGANGRALVESRYSTAALKPVYVDLFSRLFRKGRQT